MEDTFDATGPTTPPDSNSLFPPEIKSTPSAVGSAAMSNNIGTLGAEVRDLQDHEQCEIDLMLEEFIYRCGDTSKPVPDKSILLKACLNAVLPICNNTDIKQHLTDFAKCTVEPSSYAYFARAANKALIQLNALDVPGLPPPRPNDLSDIVFHRNDPRYLFQYQNPVEPPSSTHVHTATPTSKTSNDLRRQSERRKSLDKKEEEKKRNSDHLASDGPSKKRSKSSNEKNDEEEKKESIRLPAIVQNGLYVAEMFAAHTARQHVISCVVNDDVVYIRYFDRQNVIQCSGFNFIQDLPRFLVLLLIMQRMQHAQWGMNPLFGPDPGPKHTVAIEDENKRKVDLTLNLQSKDCTTHFGLRGCAINVFPVTSTTLSSLPRDSHRLNDTSKLVAKLYWPGQSRQSEPDILKEVYTIADGKREQMTDEEWEHVDGHIPEMVWFHKFEDTSTANIRRALGIDDPDRGSRVFYIVVFRKLLPITKLSGKEFLHAWWHVVLCHRVLWKYGVRHRDISLSMLMVYKTASGIWIGVLNDYDLSSTRDTATSHERTRTVSFMARGLLTEAAIEGKVEHLYRHDAESFIRVLAWVCLMYENGKLKGKMIDDWQKAKAKGRHNKKSSRRNDVKPQPSPSHTVNWEIAQDCLDEVLISFENHIGPWLPDEVVFRMWLEAHVRPWLDA